MNFKKMVNLKVDYCSHEAAKYAVEHWHYSKSLPASKVFKIGVWEDDKFIGVVLFSHGANNNIGKPYGLKQSEICELTRIALSKHKTEVSKIVSIALSFLKKNNIGLRLIVSYADTNQGHIGIIYQAGNWLYVGETNTETECFFNGKWCHRKTIHSSRGTSKGLPKRKTLPKHKYLYPLDRKMARQIKQIALPYPKKQNADSLR